MKKFSKLAIASSIFGVMIVDLPAQAAVTAPADCPGTLYSSTDSGSYTTFTTSADTAQRDCNGNVAAGMSATASGGNSNAFGNAANASGSYSIASGFHSNASGYGAIARGFKYI